MSTPTVPPIATPAGLDQLDLELTGMTCAACTFAVEAALNGLPGVHGVRVSTVDDLLKAMTYAFSHDGPHLIEVMVPEALNGVKRKVLPWVLPSA